MTVTEFRGLLDENGHISVRVTVGPDDPPGGSPALNEEYSTTLEPFEAADYLRMIADAVEAADPDSKPRHLIIANTWASGYAYMRDVLGIGSLDIRTYRCHMLYNARSIAAIRSYSAESFVLHIVGDNPKLSALDQIPADIGAELLRRFGDGGSTLEAMLERGRAWIRGDVV